MNPAILLQSTSSRERHKKILDSLTPAELEALRADFAAWNAEMHPAGARLAAEIDQEIQERRVLAAEGA